MTYGGEVVAVRAVEADLDVGLTTAQEASFSLLSGAVRASLTAVTS